MNTEESRGGGCEHRDRFTVEFMCATLNGQREGAFFASGCGDARVAVA